MKIENNRVATMIDRTWSNNVTYFIPYNDRIPLLQLKSTTHKNYTDTRTYDYRKTSLSNFIWIFKKQAIGNTMLHIL